MWSSNSRRAPHCAVLCCPALRPLQAHLYLVLEHAEAGDLRHLFEAWASVHALQQAQLQAQPGEAAPRPAMPPAMPEANARHLFMQLILALDYCHQLGIPNRDIKLENLLLAVRRDRYGCRVRDVGSPPYDRAAILSQLQITDYALKLAGVCVCARTRWCLKAADGAICHAWGSTSRRWPQRSAPPSACAGGCAGRRACMRSVGVHGQGHDQRAHDRAAQADDAMVMVMVMRGACAAQGSSPLALHGQHVHLLHGLQALTHACMHAPPCLLADFGLCKDTLQTSLPRSTVGTTQYMAPGAQT